MRIAKWLGDGCMVVAVDRPTRSPSPSTSSDRSADVCAPLDAAGGIATGYALLFEGDDYIGSAVNMASRLCDIAGHYQVLIPTMRVERLPAGVTAAPVGGVQLAGFPGEIEVVELSGVPAPADRTDTGELWTRSPLVFEHRRHLVTLRLDVGGRLDGSGRCDDRSAGSGSNGPADHGDGFGRRRRNLGGHRHIP